MNENSALTRQTMRRKLIELAFMDISRTYLAPRKARRAMARNIGKKAFQVWRNGETTNNS